MTLSTNGTVVTPHGLIEETAKRYGLTVKAMTGRGQTRWLSTARRDAARQMREHCPYLSFASIGELLGGRDHSTVVSLLKEEAT